MRPIDLIGHVDEQHRVIVELPPEILPGPINITLQTMTKDDE
ncbi:MAG TPA: hypothetical protein VH592_06605 [Gemmataceae bacterium]|jgi:hypothetical protein